jgi:hypothetical protein
LLPDPPVWLEILAVELFIAKVETTLAKLLRNFKGIGRVW